MSVPTTEYNTTTNSSSDTKVEKESASSLDPSHQPSPKALTYLYSSTDITGNTLKPSEKLKKFLEEHDFSIDDLDRQNEENETALTKAIELNLDSLARELINLGADINKPGQTTLTDLGDGEHCQRVMTALSIASYLNKIEMVNFLTSRPGIELGTHDAGEPHPIEIASHLQHQGVVAALISAGVNAGNSVAPTPIHLLAIVHFVYNSIHNALIIACRQKKKLLIYVGEEHQCCRSFFLNSIIFAISKKLGIAIALLELDPNTMALMEEYMQSEEHQDYIENYDTRIAQLKSIQSSMQAVSIDTFQAPGFDGIKLLSFENQKERGDIMESPENVDKRNEVMKDNINKTGENAVVLVGVEHLKGFMEDYPADAKIYHEISFNTIGMIGFSEFLGEKEEMEIFHFISDKVVKLQLIGNLLGYTTSRVVAEVENSIEQYLSLRSDIDDDKSEPIQSGTSRLIMSHLDECQNEVLVQTVSREHFEVQEITTTTQSRIVWHV